MDTAISCVRLISGFAFAKTRALSRVARVAAAPAFVAGGVALAVVRFAGGAIGTSDGGATSVGGFDGAVFGRLAIGVAALAAICTAGQALMYDHHRTVYVRVVEHGQPPDAFDVTRLPRAARWLYAL